MPTYTLSEWESQLIPEAFHPADQALLAQLCLSDRIEIDELKEGIRVRTRSWVGVLHFHDFELRVIPKLAGENLGLVEMLAYTAGIAALKHYDSQRYLEVAQQGSLFDLIVWLFCDACEQILAGGLLFDYETQEDSLTSLRGRLLVDRQYRRRYGQIDRLECRFDEHSSNVWENQLLALGLFEATRFAQDGPIRARARKLWTLLSEACSIDDLDVEAVRNGMLYNRLNEHYRDAHQLAWMIIDGLGIEDLFASGQRPSFAFLLDMNSLFEQFLSKYLAEVLSGCGLSMAYQRHDRSIIWDVFHNHSYSQVIPDFLVSGGGSTRRLALDAKYKIYDTHKVDSGDIAQIFLYAYAYDHAPQPAAVLVYPTGETSGQRASLLIRPANQPNGARIHVLGLNISEALVEIREKKLGTTADLIQSTVMAVFR